MERKNRRFFHQNVSAAIRKWKLFYIFTPENNEESIFVVKRVASEYSGYDHYYGIGGMYANIGGMGWG